MYSDSELFNTLLSMVKLKILSKFSIKKMQQFDIVESLLFYGQGGENLDQLPARQEGSDFKNRMKEFIDFYNINSEVIKRSVKEEEESDDLEREQRRNRAYRGAIEDSIARRRQRIISADEESETGDSDVYESVSDTGDDSDADEADTTIMGSGLERLMKLHAAIKAGNTSLRIRDEAGAILKKLLKSGKINESRYSDLSKQFQE